MQMESKLMEFEKEFGLVVNEDGKVVVSSRTVALKYGKDHSDVLKKIRKFIEAIPELAEGNFTLGSYLDENKQSRPEFLMDRQGFSILVNKFTGDDALIFTYKYTKAFEEMIEELEHRRQVSLDVVKALNEKDNKLQRKQLLESHFGKRKTVTTFKTCSYEEFPELVKLFEEYLVQIKNSEIKRIEYGRFIDGLTKNRNNISPTDKMYLPKTTTYSYFIQEFSNRKSISENKSYGQKIRYKDEIIKEQQDMIQNLNPKIDEYMIINKHGMSNNYLFENVKDKWSNDIITVKTKTYKNWINTFPSYQLIDKNELNIDWNKPIIVFLKFDCIESIDVQNLAKSILDQVITREYGEDDNIVDKVIVEKNKSVNSYKDGRIYICIRNVD